MTRHEFLKALHELLQPQSYLEVGVQHGWSLELSKAPISFGIDPQPLVPWSNVIRAESDAVWADADLITQLYPEGIDFAFIDGMHRFEYALRDFIAIMKHAHEKTVVVFDDVLPRNEVEANRVQCPGDWTGDVWKIRALQPFRPDLKFRLVDTEPTGTLVVTGFPGPRKPLSDLRRDVLDRVYESLVAVWAKDLPVPDDVISRKDAWQPEIVLEEIRNGMGD